MIKLPHFLTFKGKNFDKKGIYDSEFYILEINLVHIFSIFAGINRKQPQAETYKFQSIKLNKRHEYACDILILFQYIEIWILRGLWVKIETYLGKKSTG